MAKLTTWLLGAALVVVGCSKKNEAVEPSEVEASGGEEEVAAGEGSDEFPDAEALDELNRLFDNKRPMVGRCFTHAVSEGKVDKKASGRIMLEVDLSASGQVQGVRALSDTLRSPEVQSCVFDLVRSWEMPAPQAATKFSFAYEFQAE